MPKNVDPQTKKRARILPTTVGPKKRIDLRGGHQQGGTLTKKKGARPLK